jgi:ABC-type uncharacterized transport system permease subunit
MMSSIFLLLCTLSAAAGYLVAAWQATRGQHDVRTLGIAVVALMAHGMSLAWHLLADNGQLSLTLALSLLAWQSALLLVVLFQVPALRPLRAAIFPMASASALLSLLPAGNGAAAPHDWRIVVHVALSIFAAGLLTLAAAQAVALELLDRLLHQPQHLAKALKMPPLQSSEQWLFQLIGAGFFTLTLALVSGILFVDNLFAQHLVHKTVLSIVAWLIFGALLVGHRRYGWRGKRATRWALSGYGMLVLAYFGSKLVLEVILHRHWT